MTAMNVQNGSDEVSYIMWTQVVTLVLAAFVTTEIVGQFRWPGYGIHTFQPASLHSARLRRGRLVFRVPPRWLNILVRNEPCLCVCLCVCVSVCLSQPFIWTLFGRFWWNLDHLILSKIWDDTFLRFWKCCFDDVMAAILYVYECGTLTVAILLWFSLNFRTWK